MMLNFYRFGHVPPIPFFSVGSVQVYQAFNMLSVGSDPESLQYPQLTLGLSVYSE